MTCAFLSCAPKFHTPRNQKQKSQPTPPMLGLFRASASKRHLFWRTAQNRTAVRRASQEAIPEVSVPKKERWYKDGVKFKCTACGTSCSICFPGVCSGVYERFPKLVSENATTTPATDEHHVNVASNIMKLMANRVVRPEFKASAAQALLHTFGLPRKILLISATI